jgi:hypothetical protein
MAETFKTSRAADGYTYGMNTSAFDAARRFILTEGRLLERRVMAAAFDGEDAAGALLALAGYRNADGGFGHSLEPDKRTPASQPLDVEVAFHVMDTVGYVDHDLVTGACEFLATLGPGVGCLTASALAYPAAAHWGDWAVLPSLNPTAGLVALLWKWDVDHPWRDKATAFCWAQLSAGVPAEAHTFGEVLAFLDAVPDRARAEALIGDLRGHVPVLKPFRLDPASPGYGLTPLHYASAPDCRWVQLFDQAVLERHLDALAAAQRDDGGWPISWETTGIAAEQEWRAMETLRALRTLHAFGRI